MAHKQSSTIFMIFILIIVITNCLAKYDAKWEEAENSFGKRELYNRLLKRLSINQLTTRSSCPTPYTAMRKSGNVFCGCAYRISSTNKNGKRIITTIDGYKAVSSGGSSSGGNCGSACPSGNPSVPSKEGYFYDTNKAPFSYFAMYSGQLVGIRSCKINYK